jgi:hypothetical protein
MRTISCNKLGSVIVAQNGCQNICCQDKSVVSLNFSIFVEQYQRKWGDLFNGIMISGGTWWHQSNFPKIRFSCMDVSVWIHFCWRSSILQLVLHCQSSYSHGFSATRLCTWSWLLQISDVEPSACRLHLANLRSVCSQQEFPVTFNL